MKPTRPASQLYTGNPCKSCEGDGGWMRGGYMEQKVWGSCTYCGGTGSELTELGREVLALVSEQREELQDQIDELRRRLDENDEHDRIRAQNYYD